MEPMYRMRRVGYDEYGRMPGERADIVFGFIMQQIKQRNKRELIARLSKRAKYTRLDARERRVTVKASGISRASLYRYMWYANPTASPKKGRDVIASENAKIRICHELGWDYLSFYEDGCLVAKNGEFTTGLSYDASSGTWISAFENFDQSHLDKACEEFVAREKCSHVLVIVGYVTSKLHYLTIQNRVADVRVEGTKNVVTSTIEDLAHGIPGSYREIQIAWVAWYAYAHQPALEPWILETFKASEVLERQIEEKKKREKKAKRKKKKLIKKLKKTEKTVKMLKKKLTKKDSEIKQLKREIEALKKIVLKQSKSSKRR